MFLQRLDRHADRSAYCSRCGQSAPAGLLWTVQPASEAAALWCAACLTLEVLQRMAEHGLGPESSTPANPRCDRCKRRARPTTVHHGFNLCHECELQS